MDGWGKSILHLFLTFKTNVLSHAISVQTSPTSGLMLLWTFKGIWSDGKFCSLRGFLFQLVGSDSNRFLFEDQTSSYLTSFNHNVKNLSLSDKDSLVTVLLALLIY